jgi:endonuclease/exonuclease/phosphatase family metal-dependent hydrolase
MKVISWNIFNGQGANPTLPSPDLAEAIAACIGAVGGEILAVQEVDENQKRSGNVHQMEIIAQAMGAPHWGYARAVIGTPGFGWRKPNDEEKIVHSDSTQPGYGIGLASTIPVKAWHRVDLPASWLGLALAYPTDKGFRLKYAKDEPRVALIAELENGFTVAATHLSFVPFWNFYQLTILMRRLKRLPGKHIIIGDINLPWGIPQRFTPWKSLVSQKTFPSYKPSLQFDYLLARENLSATKINFPTSPMSDHLPIGAEIQQSS